MNDLSVHMVFSPQNSALSRLETTLTPKRRKLAERVLEKVGDCIDHPGSSFNLLLLGPRGSGKTHLLAYVRRTLEARAAWRDRFAIVPLSEEERGLTSLFDFLLTCLRAMNVSEDLIDQRLRGEKPAIAEEAAKELFREHVAGKATFLFLENLSAVFDSLKTDAVAKLRAFLQNNPNVSVLGSSVFQYTGSNKADHPFYGYFQIEPLESLGVEGTHDFLRALAAADGDTELVAALDLPFARGRVKAIHALTGGNHRLLAMLSSFLTAQGLNDLVIPFLQLADRELTPYYQQRLDRLSPQQYKIIQSIVDQHGRAVTVSEIARNTFLSPSVVSRQLHDILYCGFVNRTAVGRESYYELREPLMRLVLDIKQGRDRPLPTVVGVLQAWYSLDQRMNREDEPAGPTRALSRELPPTKETEPVKACEGVEICSESAETYSSADRTGFETIEKYLERFPALVDYSLKASLGKDKSALLALPVEIREPLRQYLEDEKGSGARRPEPIP